MKLALFTLMSCLIALSWQQHHHYRQPAANRYWPLLPYHHQQQQLPSYYQEPHQNYASFNPYYRGPYFPSAQQFYPNYYQKKIPNRSHLDELKLAALLSQQQQVKLDEAQLAAAYYPQFKEKVIVVQQPDQPIDEEAFKKFLLVCFFKQFIGLLKVN